MIDTISAFLSGIIEVFNNNAGAAVLGATLGATLSGLVIYLAERRKEKIASALRLIEEYTSPAFIEIRNDAGAAFRAALQQSPRSMDTLHSVLPPGEWRKISSLNHFYQKLDLIVSIREAHNRYIRHYFGREFPHWYVRYFEPVLEASRDEMQAHEQFPSLRHLMRHEIDAYRKQLARKAATALPATAPPDRPAA
ncbi:hypothetical protein LHP98_12660 [Rhodobacter sp. Har01]|uniref:hypothetical protein n=1 Tax=Rhodobacter sp. Har01 TaxID=2883999 RepID=UPI001D082C6A|nr:hypothetical protein [Rhodobacter sp. Har01]MCB6178975.1 hypothetical protein [Rhodobacter sp. Har01]